MPKGAISNVYGSLIKTSGDFIKACNSNSTGKEMTASILTLGIFSVSIKDAYHISNGAGKGSLKIISFKKQPLNYTSYDAREIIKYLKKHKLYIPVPKSEIETK